jgi:hypothetical protein
MGDEEWGLRRGLCAAARRPAGREQGLGMARAPRAPGASLTCAPGRAPGAPQAKAPG